MPFTGYGFDFGVFDTLLFDETGSDDYIDTLSSSHVTFDLYYTFEGSTKSDLIRVDSINIPTLLQPGSATLVVHDSSDWSIFRDAVDQEDAFSSIVSLYCSLAGADDSQLLYTGIVRKVIFSNDTVTLYLVDKLTELLNTRVGTQDNPVGKPHNRSAVYSSYSESDWSAFRRQNPLDLIWNTITAYSTLDGLAAPGNPDIDYASWATAWVDCDNLGYSLSFSESGGTIRDILAQIADYSNLYIGIDELGRLHFHLKHDFEADYATLDHSNMLDFAMEIDADKLYNKVTVNSRFQWMNGKWTNAGVSAGSYDNYGNRDRLFDSRSIWHDNDGSDASATQFASDIISIINVPNMLIRTKTTAIGYIVRPGRLFTVTEGKTELSDETFVCESIILNPAEGTTNIVGRKPAAFELAS